MKMYIKVFIVQVLDQAECTAYLNYIRYFTLYQHLNQKISSVGTYNYQLAKFLDKLLVDVIPSDHSAKDTFSFVEELKTVRATIKYMVSYDVTS